MLNSALNAELIFTLIAEKTSEILRRKQGEVMAPEPDSRLSDIGLSSLDLAELVAELEMQLGVDPFAEAYAITDISTLHELCEAYLHTLHQHDAESQVDYD
ncbi:acyl carrier protein [Xenorhabdus bovienii]|uniref:acyl carrier protein n=1 Tax=Xenorhabdus bovienii TaxID=40576 RepID=UPI0023B22D24|nr:acyl carrier protein [Xenorhabdus bovienii]MDE9482407.1 acyl carrier protein [Xenorhabdus bovienii]MDE9556283.1 acyl carrier protein [Xenorhabdus bovienii]